MRSFWDLLCLGYLMYMWHVVPNWGLRFIDLGAISLKALSKVVVAIKERCEVSAAWGAGVSISLSPFVE